MSRSQVGEGKYGRDSQRADIAAFCEANGYQIAAEYIDNVSGTKTDRPGFIALLEGAKRKEFGAVVVGKGDRLARSVKVDGYRRVLLETCGVSVLSATERNAVHGDDDGEMIEGMLGVVAQRVRKDIVRRLASACKVKANAGNYAHGAPPYGYRAENAALVDVEDEQKVIKTILAMRREGALLKDVAAYLNDAAVPTRNGNEWQINTVAAIINRMERLRKPKMRSSAFVITMAILVLAIACVQPSRVEGDYVGSLFFMGGPGNDEPNGPPQLGLTVQTAS